MIGAEAGLVSEGLAAMAVAHEESSIAKAGEEGGEAPDADFVRGGPCFSSVVGLALEGFSEVPLVVISEVDNEAVLGGFDGMEFVVVLVAITCAGWDGCEPLP